MIFVKIEKHSRARKPAPEYRQIESWAKLMELLSKTAPGANWPREEQWHTLKIRTISEAEYTRSKTRR